MTNYYQHLRKIIFVLLAFSVPIGLVAQEWAMAKTGSKVTINQENQVALVQVLKKIEQKFHVNFNYDGNLLSEIFTSALGNEENYANVEQTLDHILKPLSLKYEKLDQDYYLIYKEENTKKIKRIEKKFDIEGKPNNGESNKGASNIQNSRPVINPLNALVQRQGKEVSGKVTSFGDNEPLPGVNVVEKGTTNGTVTNVSGEYTLTVDPDATLVFSSVGYATEEIEVNNRSVVNLVMTVDVQQLQELVVVGYGEQKKTNLTGSVSDISGDKILKMSTMQTSSALQGVAPGVIIDQSSGQPGRDASSIRVRGIGSLTIGAGEYKNDPLILVDGVEADMNIVDPNNIESITVLKDAASAAIYGSRAANGVILITTKRGTENFYVNYNANLGWQRATNYPEFSGGLEFMTYLNEALTNEGKDPVWSDDFISEWKSNQPSDMYPNTDWKEEVLKPSAFQQRHNISINGGSDKITALASLTYLDQDGLVENTNYRRYGLRLNTDIRVTDKLDFGVDIVGKNYSRKQPGFGTGEVFYQTNRIPPLYDVMLDDGRWGVGWNGRNPRAMAEEGGLQEETWNEALLNLRASYEVIEGLDFTLGFAPRYNTYQNDDFNKLITTYYADGSFAYNVPQKSTLNVRDRDELELYFKAIATYSKSFNQHNINVLAGYDQTSYEQDWVHLFRDGFPLPDYQRINSGSIENQQTEGSAYEWSLRSYFGRFNYDFQGKYLFEANVRYDGSSRFAEGNKYGVFPSFSVGWRISDESFMENLGAITNLKLRGSWGKLGNQQIGTYPFLTTVDLSNDQNYSFNGTPANGGAITSLANNQISWEETEMIDIGLDLSLFQNKLEFVFDYYKKDTDGILLRLPIPQTMGLNAPFQNAGKVENRGWDLSVIHNNSVNDFNYNVNFMLSDVVNEVVDLKDTGPYNYGTTTIREGHPINAIYGYESLGLFQTDNEVGEHATQFGTVEAGDIIYKDQNGDDVINSDDRVVLGNQIPRMIYSMDISAEFRGFDARIFVQGVGKQDSYLFNEAVKAFHNGGKIQDWHIREHWTPDNPNASYPRFWFSFPNNDKTSSFWMRSGAYLRLRNLQVGYSLPQSLIETMNVQKFRIYLSGDNLFTIDDFYRGYDPETNLNNNNIYPFVSTYNLGVDVRF